MATPKNTADPLAVGPGAVLYGRPELKAVFKRNYLVGLTFSVVAHLLIISSYYLVQYLQAEDDSIPTVSVRILKYSDLGPPPSISAAPPPPTVGVAAITKPSVGVPVPVPDAEVSPEQTLATQQELSSVPSPALDEYSSGGDVQITQDILIDDAYEPGMDEFIPVEKPPQIVVKVVPSYPEMAIRAGIEGTVWVKILVDKEGKPVRAVVVRSTTEIFNEPAVQAAMKFVFTPAIMNNGPVKVWVSLPFRFRLKDASSI